MSFLDSLLTDRDCVTYQGSEQQKKDMEIQSEKEAEIRYEEYLKRTYQEEKAQRKAERRAQKELNKLLYPWHQRIAMHPLIASILFPVAIVFGLIYEFFKAIDKYLMLAIKLPLFSMKESLSHGDGPLSSLDNDTIDTLARVISLFLYLLVFIH